MEPAPVSGIIPSSVRGLGAMFEFTKVLGRQLRDALSQVPRLPISWSIIDSHEHLRETEQAQNSDNDGVTTTSEDGSKQSEL
jgi:hypothetical protein